MKEIVLITGANGATAKSLAKKLDKDFTLRFLTRKRTNDNEFEWNIAQQTIDEKALENVSHVIHLAGANISEKRWTEDRKKEIITSRVDSAELILKTLKNKNIKLKSFISASAVGYYGAKTVEKIFVESDEKGNDFLSEVVYLWENAADEFSKNNIAERVVKLRTGVVLSASEGALEKITFPIKLGLGSPVGSGKQYLPWIHIDDLCSMYEQALKSENLRGTYNACAPEHITNEFFTKKLAKVLKKPLIMPKIPETIMKLVFGEMASILLEGSRCSPEKIMQTGFVFEYPDLEYALENLLVLKK